MPGFPSPQFTASAGTLPRLALATPVDLRPSGWGVCVAQTYIGASLFSFANEAASVCPIAKLGQKLLRHTLIASSAGQDLDPYERVPVDVDHIRIRRAGIHPDPRPAHGHLPSAYQLVPEASRTEVDVIQAHIDDAGHFLVAVHAPDCISTTIEVHVHESPHALVRRASQHYLPFRAHSTVQACWPIEQPRSHSHLLHLMLDFDCQRTPDTTMFLVDCRGVGAEEGDFVAFSSRRDLTAGELFAILRDKVSCALPPADILINNRPLTSMGARMVQQSAHSTSLPSTLRSA